MKQQSPSDDVRGTLLKMGAWVLLCLVLLTCNIKLWGDNSYIEDAIGLGFVVGAIIILRRGLKDPND